MSIIDISVQLQMNRNDTPKENNYYRKGEAQKKFVYGLHEFIYESFKFLKSKISVSTNTSM